MNEEYLNKVLHGDCFEWLPQIEDKSISAIIADLPYGTTNCKWDTPLDLEKLWSEYNRIIKNEGAIVLFGSQPFTTTLISSNLRNFKYCWVWNKKIAGNPFLAKRQPLKIHEDICVFSNKPHNYFPLMTKGKPRKKGGGKTKLFNKEHKTTFSDEYYPTSIIEFSNAKRGVHPTEKPLCLISYLVRTYSSEGDTILDNTAGSGTLGVACINEGRNFILMEKEWEYCEIANERIKEAKEQIAIK